MTRKEAILKAAISLFAERGFSAATTSAVAKKADVAEGLIFHYFKNKEGILVYILKEMIDAYIEGVEVIVRRPLTGLEAIENLLSYHFLFSDKRANEFLVTIRDFPFALMEPGSPTRDMITDRSAKISELVCELIERGIKDGSIEPVPVEQTGFIIQGMLNGISRLKMLGPIAMPDLSTDVLNFCRRALAGTRKTDPSGFKV